MSLDEIIELKQLLAIVALTSPDGRWEALQDFIASDPKWKRREKDFLESLPEDAPRIICRWIDVSPSLIPFIDKDGSLRREAINGFKTLQQLYKERKGEFQNV